MYKLIKKIENRNLLFISSDSIYLLDTSSYIAPKLINADFDFEEIFTLKLEKYPQFSFHKKIYFAGSFSSKKFSIYEINTNKKLKSYNQALLTSNGFPYESDSNIFFLKENRVNVISVNNWQNREYSIEKSLFYQLSHPNYHLFVNNEDRSSLFVYDNKFEKLIWQKDFSDISAYNDPFNDEPNKGRIHNVQLYQKDKIILTTRHNSTFCFDIHTGKEIWRTWTFGGAIEIVGNIGYVCTGGSLYKLNLDTGEALMKSIYHDNHLPDIKYNGETYRAHGHNVVHHEGLLWYAVYSSGHSFILAINPHDGHYEWVHHVETNEKVMDIYFYKDKMFLQDSGSTLHIYEKEV